MGTCFAQDYHRLNTGCSNPNMALCIKKFNSFEENQNET